LSDREISCLRHAATGATLVEGASSLGISKRTIELHLARVTQKLGAANRINAVAIAIGAGLIDV
ncbi:MAG: response regulator transcription factor, partial [Tsuneonella suprasediminis]